MLSLQQISCGSPVAPAAAAGISPKSSRRIAPVFRRQSSIRAAGTSCMDSVSTISRCNQSLYDVLGVGQHSDVKEIKSAYRHLARATHPDVVTMECKEESTKEFLRIHAAYTTLSDPESRARYDLQLSMQSLPRLSPRAGGFSGFGYDFAAGSSPFSSPSASRSPSSTSQWKTSKSWETDQCW